MSIDYFLFYFGGRVVWNPEWLVFTILLTTLYFVVIGPLRSRFPDAEPVPISKQIRFVLGMVLFYFAIGGPVNLIGHFLFGVHMVQQTALYMMMPPLLIIGMPDWLLRAIIQKLRLSKLILAISKPLIGLFTFNVLFSFYHFPLIFDTVKTDFILHNLMMVVLLIAAFAMWWPVLTPLPEFNRLSELRKMGYMFLNGVLLTPACALIIFAKAPLFDTYISGPVLLCTPFYAIPLEDTPRQLYTSLSVLNDQQLGGVIMKLIQETVYSSVIAYNFFRWFRKERGSEPDGISTN